MLKDLKKEEAFLDWKRLLWLCLPAILLGLFLRIFLMTQLPYCFVQPDSIDLLETPDHLLRKGTWYIAAKKTFLTPLLYTLTFFLPFPALTTIALGQHALGLLLILMIGLISRLWFKQWPFLIPVTTLLTAANPTLLWYEHTLMAESHYVFCAVLTALTGTIFAKQKNVSTFIIFLVSLFLTAGSRPEGKLFFGFGLLLTLIVSYRSWRTLAWQLPLLILIGFGTSRLTRSSQAGLLLYTSVITLTPDSIKTAPGFEPYILPIRDRLKVEWKNRFNDMAIARKEISQTVETYLESQNENSSSKAVNRFCLKIAVETCLKNPWHLPGIALKKFRQTILKISSGSFDDKWLIQRQMKTVTGDFEILSRHSQKLTGKELSHLTDFKNFVIQNYQLPPDNFFLKFQGAWSRFINSGLTDSETLLKIPPLPAFYWLAIAGFFLSPLLQIRNKSLIQFHLAWLIMLLGLWFVIFLTANTKERFRFVFEPFWILYLAACLDLIATAFKAYFPFRQKMLSAEIPKSGT